MNKTEIMNRMSRTVHRTGLKLKKHSPEILIVVGVAGAVTSAVMACKATLKVNETVKQAKVDLEDIKEAAETGLNKAGNEYTVEDANSDRKIVFTQTGLELFKAYGPAVGLGVASIGCIFASNNIIRKRNVALSAAYTALDKTFKDYRSRVIERFGKELDRELKYNVKSETFEERVVDENGNEKIVKQTVDVAHPSDYSAYSIVFDDGNAGWEKDAECNKFFLVQQQNYANDLLKTRGHLFLNEVYDLLGARRTKSGAQVGWIYDPDHDHFGGDGFVDFGMFDIERPKARDFINGHEKVIILDFNVDGVILDHI